VAVCLSVTAYLACHQQPEFYDSLHRMPQVYHEVAPWHKGVAHAMKYFWDVVLALAGADLKFMFFITYLSIATTFFPLPTGALVSFVAAERGQFVPSDLWNAALVATFGAVASTIANMTDYYFFLWLLRSHRVAKIRNTRAYVAAAKWFAKAPFKIMVAFNVILVPVDIPRMLAAIYGYSRKLFAAANFFGRFFRYLSIVAVTVLLGPRYDWIGPLTLLGIAIALGLAKAVPVLWRRALARAHSDPLER
jgi:membrane protein YqaA with SNARE-associated domain